MDWIDVKAYHCCRNLKRWHVLIFSVLINIIQSCKRCGIMMTGTAERNGINIAVERHLLFQKIRENVLNVI